MTERVDEFAVDVWARLIRTQTELLEAVHQALKAAKLPPLSWYDVLLELERSGEQGLRQYEIGREVLLTKHNLSRLIDRMEKVGAVSRADCPEDGRGNVVFITAAGRALRRRMWPVYAGVIQSRFASRLDASELTSLGSILARLRSP